MLQRVEVDVTGGLQALTRPLYRYRLLASLNQTATRAGIRVYAFGFGDRHLRLLVSGSSGQIGRLTRGVKVGASNVARAKGLPWSSEQSFVHEWRGSVLEGAAWCHRSAGAPGRRVDALSSPWTSHRDVLGFRSAPFFDAGPLKAAVDVQALHRACGAGPVPRAPLRPPAGARGDLSHLMRISAAVMGVLAPHRRCIPTFVHLASVCGAQRSDLCDALDVGERRVRQLLGVDPVGIVAAMASLSDPRLARVP